MRRREQAILYKLGETKTEISIDTAEENRNIALSLVKQARYSIEIFSHDLDAAILDNQAFEQSLAGLAREHPGSRIRVLVRESDKAVQNGHCLIRLAQTLTSSIFIKKLSRIHHHELSAFIVADATGLLYRANADQLSYEAIANFNAPAEAGKLLHFFNEAWEHAEPDPQIRRLYI